MGNAHGAMHFPTHLTLELWRYADIPVLNGLMCPLAKEERIRGGRSKTIEILKEFADAKIRQRRILQWRFIHPIGICTVRGSRE